LALAGTSFEQSDETAHVWVEGGAVVVVVEVEVDASMQDEPDASKPERQPARSGRGKVSFRRP